MVHCFVSGILVHECGWSVRLLRRLVVLWLIIGKRVVVLEMWLIHMMLVWRKLHHSSTMYVVLSGWHRQWRTESHSQTHARCVQVSSLAVVDGIDSAWRWCIIAGCLIHKVAKSEGARVEQ